MRAGVHALRHHGRTGRAENAWRAVSAFQPLAQGLEATARPDPRHGSVTLARGCLADESDSVLGYEAILHASATPL